MTEEQVFQAALELADEAARAAYLDETCGKDLALRRQVEALLAAHFKSGEVRDVTDLTVFSVNTAGVHVSRILTKLGVATRTEAAALARDHDLVGDAEAP